MTTKRRARDAWSWTAVRLPERALSDSILHLAAPLLELMVGRKKLAPCVLAEVRCAGFGDTTVVLIFRRANGESAG